MPYLKATADVSLYYEEFGRGKPIVFITGGHGTHSLWEEQVPVLARQYRTITFDWRGTGQSSRVPTDYSLRSALDDYIALIENVASEQVTAVGYGIGTHIVLLAAKERPNLFNHLVLISSAPWFSGARDNVPGGLPEDFVGTLGTKAGVTYADLVAKMTDKYLFYKPVSDAVRMSTIMQQLQWPRYVFDSYMRDMAKIDHREYLPSIKHPTLICHGRFDEKQRLAGAEYLSRALPNAELLVFEKSAHSPHAEEPEKFNNAALAFLG